MTANCFAKSTCIVYEHDYFGEEEMGEENIFATGIVELLTEIDKLGIYFVRFNWLVHQNSLH
jgi:hypothetical protein